MKHDADWKIIATLGFLVATVAVPTVASLVAPEEHKQLTPAKSIVTESDRKPANINQASNSHVVSYDINCTKPSSLSVKAEGPYIQMTGRNCSKGKARKPMTITNKTNGFQASIFDLDKAGYQTDLIQLKAGENQISVQIESTSGVTEETILNVHTESI